MLYLRIERRNDSSDPEGLHEIWALSKGCFPRCRDDGSMEWAPRVLVGSGKRPRFLGEFVHHGGDILPRQHGRKLSARCAPATLIWLSLIQLAEHDMMLSSKRGRGGFTARTKDPDTLNPTEPHSLSAQQHTSASLPTIDHATTFPCPVHRTAVGQRSSHITRRSSRLLARAVKRAPSTTLASICSTC